jgi:hypothetical protein
LLFFGSRDAAEAKARELRKQGHIASVEQLPAIDAGLLNTADGDLDSGKQR